MLSNEILEKLKNEQILSVEEIKYVLDYIVEEARKNSGIIEIREELYFKKPEEIEISDYTVCEKCCEEIGKICKPFKIKYSMVCTEALLIPDLKHYFEIIKFNSEENLVFIVDLTYIQFLKHKYPVDINGKTVYVAAPGRFFSRNNKNELMWNGYITCTEQNFRDYINSFIMSNKTLRSINQNEILDFSTSQVSKVFGFTDVKDFEQLLEDELEKNKTNS